MVTCLSEFDRMFLLELCYFKELKKQTKLLTTAFCGAELSLPLY